MFEQAEPQYLIPSIMNAQEAISTIFFFLSTFGVFYLFFTTRHRERMAAIEKGMLSELDPMEHPQRALRNGLVLVGAAIGMCLGWVFQRLFAKDELLGPFPYFVGMAFCCGVALIIYYRFFASRRQA